MGFKKHEPAKSTRIITIGVYKSKSHQKGHLSVRFGTAYHPELAERYDVFFGVDEDEGWMQLLPNTKGDGVKVQIGKAGGNGKNNLKATINVSGIISSDLEDTISARTCTQVEEIKTKDGLGFHIKIPPGAYEYLEV